MNERQGHGWWPYLLPYFSFLLVVEIGRGAPGAAGLILVAKPVVPAAIVVYFARRGSYAELRGFTLAGPGVWLDVALGVALAVLWMAPYIVFDGLRPDPIDAFDPAQLGAALAPAVVAVRFAGYAFVTPVFEELFIRSFVMRYAEVFNKPLDFRDVPIAHFTLQSFLIASLVFTAGHVPWEWWVAIPWVVVTNLWFYHRRHLMAVIVVHGVTNASILVFVTLGNGLFTRGDGGPLSLWFFV